jgi:hypothetical protein
MANITAIGRLDTMKVPSFIRRFFVDEEAHCPGPEPSDAVVKAEALIDEIQPLKRDLAVRLERTGFLLGDAVLARIDRRYLDEGGSSDHA